MLTIYCTTGSPLIYQGVRVGGIPSPENRSCQLVTVKRNEALDGETDKDKSLQGWADFRHFEPACVRTFLCVCPHIWYHSCRICWAFIDGFGMFGQKYERFLGSSQNEVHEIGGSLNNSRNTWQGRNQSATTAGMLHLAPEPESSESRGSESECQ